MREVGVAHKIERQAPVVDDAPRTRGVPNKRDTKRWCKGKVGVEHKLTVATRSMPGKDHGLPESFKNWLVRYCTTCGKEIAWYYPMGRAKKNPPEWVLEFRAKQYPAAGLPRSRKSSA